MLLTLCLPWTMDLARAMEGEHSHHGTLNMEFVQDTPPILFPFTPSNPPLVF